MATVETKSPTKIITAREAAQAAFDYLNKLLTPGTVEKPVLEEVELTDDEQHWLITIGYVQREGDPLVPAFVNPPVPKLKLFKVDSRSGRVVSMKIRPSP
jgi:hypothetical protein